MIIDTIFDNLSTYRVTEKFIMTVIENLSELKRDDEA